MFIGDKIVVLKATIKLKTIKMGQAKVEQAAANLLRLKSRVDEEKMNPPSFLTILTGNGYAL